MKVYCVYTHTKNFISLHIDKRQAEYSAAKYHDSYIETRNVAKCYVVIEHFHDYRGVDRDDVIGVFYDYKRAKILADVAYKYHVGKYDSKVIIRMMYNGGFVEYPLQTLSLDYKEKFYKWCMENGKWQIAKGGYIYNQIDVWRYNSIPKGKYPKCFPTYDIHKAYRALKKLLMDADLSKVDYVEWETYHSDYDKQKRTGEIWAGGNCAVHYTKEQALKNLEEMYEKEKQSYKPDEFDYMLVVSEDGKIIESYHDRTHKDSPVGKFVEKSLAEGCHVEQFHGTLWEVEWFRKENLQESYRDRFDRRGNLYFRTLDDAIAEVKRICESDTDKYVAICTVRWGGNIVHEVIKPAEEYALKDKPFYWLSREKKRYKVADDPEKTRQNHINALKQILEEDIKTI